MNKIPLPLHFLSLGTKLRGFLLRKNNLIPVIFAFLVTFSSCNSKKSSRILTVTYKELHSVDDILPLSGDSLVKPVIYKNVVSLEDLPVEEKKEKFIAMLLPAVMVAKFRIENNRRKIKRLNKAVQDDIPLTSEDSAFVEQQKILFKTDDFEVLDRRMRTHPVSIVLAQAILECGWGTSRFFTDANNVFGIWSENPAEERISSLSRRNGKNIFLRKYEHLSSSIEDYFYTIGRSAAYRKFREKRIEITEPYELTKYLTSYSELGQEYVEKLNMVIRANDLQKYDHYIIHPEYFSEY